MVAGRCVGITCHLQPHPAGNAPHDQQRQRRKHRHQGPWQRRALRARRDGRGAARGVQVDVADLDALRACVAVALLHVERGVRHQEVAPWRGTGRCPRAHQLTGSTLATPCRCMHAASGRIQVRGRAAVLLQLSTFEGLWEGKHDEATPAVKQKETSFIHGCFPAG